MSSLKLFFYFLKALHHNFFQLWSDDTSSRKTPPRQPIIDGEVEAKLIALRCGEPPAGQARWTLRLLADKAVELEIVPAISHETVRQVLKKTN